MAKKRVGVLALQGDYEAHIRAVRAAGGEGFEVRSAEELATADALILPGGESTTMGHLLKRSSGYVSRRLYGQKNAPQRQGWASTG